MNRRNLAKIFKKEGVRSDMYSLYGASTDDCIIINKIYTKWYYRFIPDDAISNKHYATWEVFYSERGNKHIIKICNSEEDACVCVHQEVVTCMLSMRDVWFSYNPVCLPDTIILIKEKGIIETGVRVWIDSMIDDGTLPKDISSMFFVMEQLKDEERFTIHFYGSKNVKSKDGTYNFSMNYIPRHDSMSIGFTNMEIVFKGELSDIISRLKQNFDKDFSDIISKLKQNKDNTAYKGFFDGKSIYVGFKDNLHVVQ